MFYDHEAVRKAYPEVVSIADNVGAFKEDGTEVTIVQSAVDAARVTLNAEAAAIAYQQQRTGADGTTDTIYPTIGDQLDMLYKDMLAGKLDTTGTWATAIKATKDKYPKPS